MKLTIGAKPFAAAVKRVAPLARTGSLPALASIHLDAGDGALTLTAGNLEHFIRTEVEAEVHEPGAVLVPGKMLVDATGVFEGDVEVGAGDSFVATAGRRAVSLPVGDLGDYPRIEWPGGEGTPLGAAWDRIRAIAWTISTDVQRPEFTVLRIEDGGTAVAADGYSMGWCDVPEGLACAIPGAIVALALKTVREPLLSVTDRHVLFVDGSTRLLATQAVVQDLPWRTYLEQKGATTWLPVDAGALIDELAAVTGVDTGSPAKHVRLDFDGESLHVVRRAKDGPDVAGAVDAEGGLAGPLGVDGVNLAAALRSSGGGTARIGTSSPGAPLFIEGEAEGVGQMLMVVHLSGAMR